MSTDKNKNIKYGDVDVLPPGVEYNPKDVKVKISMFLDGDIIKVCKDQAAKNGMGYQTFINLTLRKLLIDMNTDDLSARVSALETIVRFYLEAPKKKRSKKAA